MARDVEMLGRALEILGADPDVLGDDLEGDDLEGDDLEGDDLEGEGEITLEDLVGAKRARRIRRAARRRGGRKPPIGVRRRPPLLPGPAGVQELAVKEFPFGLGVANFGANAVVQLQAVAAKAGRPKRLVLARTDLGGGTVPGSIIVTGIQIGVDQQLMTVAGIPIELFAFNAVAVPLVGQTIPVGQIVTVTLVRSIPPVPGNEAVSGSLVCDLVA
jgi:hypothetical protein